MSHSFWTVTIVALFPLAGSADAQDIRTVDPLFQDDSTLEVVLQGPFAEISRERSDEEELPGLFRYQDADGTEVLFDVQYRARGNWRRNPRICRFPPIRINFKKSQTDETLFANQDKLKLVTHCQNRSRAYDQAVISEYLVYRMLNVLTDYSYRVRLLKIRYEYADDNTTLDTYGVLIEHNDRISERIGGEPVEIEKVRVSSIKPDDLNLASMFQYFVGNTDFSPVATEPNERCCHNQTLFANEDGLYRTVPYDFDQTGIVDARHAAPNPRFKINSVRVRLYRGRCANNQYLQQTLQAFNERRAAIEALVENQPELTSSTRRNMLRYIDSFYDTTGNPKRVESRIVERCL